MHKKACSWDDSGMSIGGDGFDQSAVDEAATSMIKNTHERSTNATNYQGNDVWYP